MLIEELSHRITGRQTDLFIEDIQDHSQELQSKIQSTRILVIGGAGSIGSSTIRAILPYKPKTLHVVDQNENGLAELVRDLRSSFPILEIEDFRTLPLDFGSPVMQRFLLDSPPYDYVLNFAALKHVRSEKDTYSLMQLLDTNIIKPARFLHWLADQNHPLRYFCVSTDKAANPVNFMGASKRAMERLIFSDEIIASGTITMSSARFANVAFSQGSLLDSFLIRMQKQQPLAVPEHTRRFFLSMRESGQICLLATFCAADKQIFVPRLSPDSDLILLEQVACRILESQGYIPRIYRNESDVKKNLYDGSKNKEYPLLLTPLDTSGEKSYEEFVGQGEIENDIGMKSVLSVSYRHDGHGSMNQFLETISDWISHPSQNLTKEDLRKLLDSIVPQFHHRETHKNLDQRM